MSARLLSDLLPLRRSLVLPNYRDDVILPWVYGRVTLAPIPLDDAGLEYLVADHPIVAVERVTVGGLPITGWMASQSLDATGHAIAKISLTTAPKSGDSVAVSLIGRRHPTTGAALEHPADIAENLLSAGGWSVDASAFGALRDAFPALALGGIIDTETTIRAAVSTIMDNCGAGWCASPLRAWQIDSSPIPLATLTPTTSTDASAQATHTDLVTRLVLSFDYDWAQKAARGSMVLEAPDSIEQFGAIESQLELPWVRFARDAFAIAAAHLQRVARPIWTFTVTTGPGSNWLPGDMLAFDHPWIPAGPAMIARITRTVESRSITLTAPARIRPRVELVRRGSLIEGGGTDPLTVTYRDGVATFTILTDMGDPLAGASVTLDSSETRTTDRTGQVQFKTTRGAHSLLVVANGYAPFEMDVTV